jgi:hypothetical protein
MIKDTGGNVSICAHIGMAMGHGLPMIKDRSITACGRRSVPITA